jgi:spermidine synthase
VICEIEPLIPPAAHHYFKQENHGVIADRRVEIVYDDARHYILTTDEKFDIITSDPIHPWVKGAAALYSREYFQLCLERLNPGGIVTQWVPLYETNLDAVRSQFATFFQVFSDGTVWGNALDGQGYDVVLLGQREPVRIDMEAIQQRLDRNDYHAVLVSLQEVDQGSALDLVKTYAGRGRDLKTWAEGAEINRDQNLRLQYLAGMGLNTHQSAYIYDTVVAFRQYPDDLIAATGVQEQTLRQALGPPSVGR